MSPECPQCTMTDVVDSGDGFECTTCGFEWSDDSAGSSGSADTVVIDANGAELADGDNVTVIKDLKLDGKVGGVKVGTKVRGIRLVPGDHPVSGKVDGRSILIKAEFVKKAK